MNKLPHDDWYKSFFSGAALELWRNAKSFGETEDECAFLREALSVSNGAHLLDVPCGNGRLSIPMAMSSYDVTGVDFCDEFIREGKALAESASSVRSRKSKMGKVEFVQGDMRTWSVDKQFDGAYCMGNSFGYFNREGTRQALAAIANNLKAGAKFVIDSAMIAETFFVNGGEREWIRVGDMLMLIENSYDCRQNCLRTDYTFIRNGKEETRQAVHWIYTAGEVCSMLEDVGFAINDLFASTDCEPYTLGCERLLLVAEKQ